MLYVIDELTDKVLFKIDAWAVNAEGMALNWIRENGYEVSHDEITIMGNMLIWVRGC